MFRFLRSTLLWIVLVPYLITFVGAASNQLVLNANNDEFPVRINPVKVKMMDTHTDTDGTVYLDPTHIVMTPATHLNLLADIIDFRDAGIYSVGDLLIDFGGWLQMFCPFVWVALVVERLRRP